LLLSSSTAPFPIAPTSVWASVLSFLSPTEWCVVELVSHGAHQFIASRECAYWTPFLARYAATVPTVTTGAASLAATNVLEKKHADVAVRRWYDTMSSLELLSNGWLGALDYDTFLTILPAVSDACDCRSAPEFTGDGGHWTSWALPWTRGDIPHTDADGMALFHPTQVFVALSQSHVYIVTPRLFACARACRPGRAWCEKRDSFPVTDPVHRRNRPTLLHLARPTPRKMAVTIASGHSARRRRHQSGSPSPSPPTTIGIRGPSPI
jgi:hypothetical protein